MTIASFCCEQLRSRGPLTLETLTDLATDSGVTRARDPLATVRSALAHRAVQLGDGRWASPLQLLEGRVLTTAQPTAAMYDEPEPAEPGLDLELLRLAACERPIPLAQGGSLRNTNYRTLSLPDFSGARLAPDELLGLRLRDGVLHTEPTPQTPELRHAGRLLADALGPLEGRRTPYWSTGLRTASDSLALALWDRMAADPEFLTSPVPPFSTCIPALVQGLHEERERQQSPVVALGGPPRPPLRGALGGAPGRRARRSTVVRVAERVHHARVARASPSPSSRTSTTTPTSRSRRCPIPVDCALCDAAVCTAGPAFVRSVHGRYCA